MNPNLVGVVLETVVTSQGTLSLRQRIPRERLELKEAVGPGIPWESPVKQ